VLRCGGVLFASLTSVDDETDSTLVVLVRFLIVSILFSELPKKRQARAAGLQLRE